VGFEEPFQPSNKDGGWGATSDLGVTYIISKMVMYYSYQINNRFVYELWVLMESLMLRARG
jgi:hypothetical protein